MQKALGVDIGGTSIATAIVDENRKIIARTELKSITDDREAMFSQVIKSIDKTLQRSKIRVEELKGIGLGVPGKVDRQKGIALYQNNLPWKDFPLRMRLKQHYQVKDIQIDNDVHAATLAEWKASKLGVDSILVYMTISTGISSAIIHEGGFLRGAGFAGEIGFLPVSSDLVPTKLLRLEEIASGPAIGRFARKHLKDDKLTSESIFNLAQEGNQLAQKIIYSTTKTIASALYTIHCLLDPDQIILGGGVINKNPDLLSLIQTEVAGLAHQSQADIGKRITLSHYNKDSGVIGASLLVQG